MAIRAMNVRGLCDVAVLGSCLFFIGWCRPAGPRAAYASNPAQFVLQSGANRISVEFRQGDRPIARTGNIVRLKPKTFIGIQRLLMHNG